MEKLHQEITDKIVAMLQQGEIPWTKPWVCGGQILSYASGKPYSLLNRMLLGRPGEYATFKQVQEAGGRVRKGAKSERIYFYKPIITEVISEENGKQVIKQKISLIFKAYNVFHLSDTQGLKPRWTKETSFTNENKTHEIAEGIVQSYTDREKIRLIHSEEDSAFFSPSQDKVQLPPINKFNSSNDYYGVLFHELTHSTGIKARLNRFTEGPQPFGSEDYSKEELVAEMGSAMMLAELGLETNTTHTSNAAYIQNWLTHIKGDANMVVSAASKAEKAINYIMGIK